MGIKITVKHLERKVFIYIRQSSPAQVLHNQESTKRQYRLKKRALQLGWPENQIEVIDEDQGQSGATADKRKGFQRMVSEVALGEVGAIFGIEISRLARSCADWYRLMEVSALTGTLIIDEEGMYDANQYNDRLLLGLKATLSEAELHFLKQRMVGGRRQKAQRGEFRIRLPIGYIWDGAIQMDPDERVRDTIFLFFSCFKRFGTATAVARYFEDQRQLFPRRDGWGNLRNSVNWGPLSISRTAEILKNPIYAGVYVYDRKNPQKMDPESVHSSGSIWISNSHQGYIDVERYEKNINILKENRGYFKGMQNKGSAREGKSLLQGIVVCGICGCRMLVSYDKKGIHSYYCRKRTTNRSCQLVRGDHVDQTIKEIVLETITHEELDIALKVFEKISQRAQELDNQWKKRLEAAHYEADKAARRYYQVEPENRLVARTLEHNWNERLAEAESLEKEYEKIKKTQPFKLDDEQKTLILNLAQDIPKLWSEPTTLPNQRKQLIRLLIEDVTLRALNDPWGVEMIVQWKTGITSKHMTQRAKAAATSPDLVNRIHRLFMNQTDREIADILNQEGQKSASGRKFNEKMISSIRKRRGWKKNNCTSTEVVKRLMALNNTHTDQEISEILNQEGYQSAKGQKFKAKIVSGLREWNNIKKPWYSNQTTIQRIKELSINHTDSEIADKLNQEEYRSATGRKFTAKIVCSTRQRYGIFKQRHGD